MFLQGIWSWPITMYGHDVDLLWRWQSKARFAAANGERFSVVFASAIDSGWFWRFPNEARYRAFAGRREKLPAMATIGRLLDGLPF